MDSTGSDPEKNLIKKIKLPDCIIAATALDNNVSLVTRNVKDFQHIDELPIIDPFLSRENL